MNKLTDAVENQILSDLYDRDINNNLSIDLDINSYELEEKFLPDKLKEFVSKIEHLSRLNYIKVDPNYYTRGGIIDKKYKNNALLLEQAKIHIAPKGKAYIEEFRKKWYKKALDVIVAFGKDICSEVRTAIISAIAGGIVGFIVGKLL